MSPSMARRSFVLASGVAAVAAAAPAIAGPASAAAVPTETTITDPDVLVVEEQPGANDTLRWRLAIAAAVANPGTYSRIQGTAASYRIVDPLAVDGLTDITIAGLGAQRTVFYASIDTGASLKEIFTNRDTAPVTNVTFRDFAVHGGMLTLDEPESGQRLRDDRPWPPSFKDCLLMAIRLSGSLHGLGTHEVRDISVRGVHIYGTRELPLLFRGCSGTTIVADSLFERCKDVGYTFCQDVVFARNRVHFSADNGVSISRGNAQGACYDNVIVGSYHSGVLAGGNVSTAERGPTNVTVERNTISYSGHFGVDASLGPEDITIHGNTISRSKIGVVVCGWVFDAPDSYTGDGVLRTRTPDHVARRVSVQDNVIADSIRGGIATYTSEDVTIAGNTITFSPVTEPLGTAAKGGMHLYGVSNQGVIEAHRPTSDAIDVLRNTIVDTRSTGALLDGVTYLGSTGWTLTDNLIRGAMRPTTTHPGQ